MEKQEHQTAPVLSVKNLSVSFTQYTKGLKQKKLQVIRDLSFDIHAGEVVAVVGSSGSGKSLLAHAVMGLLPYNGQWSGEITYCGEPLTEKALKKLRGRELVLVPQSVSFLDPLMKVGEQVRRGRRDTKSRRTCTEVLARYGLDAATEELYPFELSGGMSRRILISTAVQEKPKLVIADEPTPGLHLDAAKRVMGHFREIADERAGVLLITHDLELALTAADRIVVFYAGTNLENAAAGDFNEEAMLRHPYTRALYRAMPQHGFQAVPGIQPYAGEMPEGCPYGPRCEQCDAECLKAISYRELRGGRVRCRNAV